VPAERLPWNDVTAPLHALVVDDDVSIRVLVTRVLERRSFTVATARDGAEAIEKLAAATYAVIVLDLMMPRIDGAGFLKYLEQYHPEQLPAVIVMTAFGEAAVARLSPQPAHFLEKPFDVNVLVDQVSECLRAATAGRATMT
jgi:DNA-binding NtrC family response regulator